MGMKSTKADKNIYHISREESKLTREAASEKLFISPDRIEKIEMRGAIPHPDEVLAMASVYKNPMLCNYFCSHECEIGQAYIPEVQIKDISQITLEMLANLNKLSKAKDRLIDITVDGEINQDEINDFKRIFEMLNQMSMTIDSMKLWVQQQIVAGNIDENEINL